MADLTSAIAGYWDAAAPCFDDEPDHGLRDAAVRAAWMRVLERWLPAPPSDVLDVGCGTGTLSLLLGQAGHQVTGVDLSAAMIDLARTKLVRAGVPATVLVGDATRPPVGGKRFDVVLSRHLLWTLPDPQEALRAWIALLHPGGRLVLIEGRWCPPGRPATPYVDGAQALPWDGGISATDLTAIMRTLVRSVSVEDLSRDPELWGRPVTDERYVLLAQVD